MGCNSQDNAKKRRDGKIALDRIGDVFLSGSGSQVATLQQGLNHSGKIVPLRPQTTAFRLGFTRK